MIAGCLRELERSQLSAAQNILYKHPPSKIRRWVLGMPTYGGQELGFLLVPVAKSSEESRLCKPNLV